MFVPVILFIIGLCMSAVILPLSVGLYIYIEQVVRGISTVLMLRQLLERPSGEHCKGEALPKI